LELSRKHRKFTKDNFSFDKMVELMGTLIDETKVASKPQTVGLQLPKLKKVGSTTEAPKLTLPTLKRAK
jgi:hypothetical protein